MGEKDVAMNLGAGLLQTGERIGKWRVVEELGSGGQGRVYCVENAAALDAIDAELRHVHSIVTGLSINSPPDARLKSAVLFTR